MKKLIFLFSLLAFVACKNQNSESQEVDAAAEMEEMVTEEVQETEEATQENYDPKSSDDQMAANITNFLTLDYLKGDLELMTENDRKFQYYAVDLNEDGKDEYIVRFMSSYFCGSGGCTFLVLDHESKVVTKLMTTRPPLYAAKSTTNGWRDILVRTGGELKQLKFENGTYPNNPSMLPKAPFDAPSASAIIMFDDHFAKGKTYTY